MPDMKPLFHLAIAGLGAFVGLCLVPFVAGAAWFFPSLWMWLFAPVPLCAVCGLIFARELE